MERHFCHFVAHRGTWCYSKYIGFPQSVFPTIPAFPRDSAKRDPSQPHSFKVAPPAASAMWDEGKPSLERGQGCPVKGDKEFRRRRLTFAAQGRMSSNTCPPSVQTSPIYRALEREEENAHRVAPFPASVLGIYSCHGAEPGWEEGQEDLAKINQDRACVVHPFMGSETCALFCIYDGHGERGEMVSNYAMNEVPRVLAGHPRLFDNPGLALQETFEKIDEALGEASQENEHVYSGTTALVALYRDNHLWIANAGDSRAVLGTANTEAPSKQGNHGLEYSGTVPVALSDDHNPDRPGELERIESCGGFVSPPPEEGLSARVWLDEELTRIGLAMSRSIGDHAVKDVGVIATPEIKFRDVAEGDAFLILASDGVWEFMENQEVVDLVQSCLCRGGGGEADEACAELIAAAAKRWRHFEGAYRDDISCIVLRLPRFHAAVRSVASSDNLLARENAIETAENAPALRISDVDCST